ncbi:MAG: hypothetical protein ACU0A2_15025, partial [Cognatishimia sp.]|uniref:hypothetical protein n=1 Tax=Cognatishimia sp. TaxID=2211648 RepID=UPI004057EC0C
RYRDGKPAGLGIAQEELGFNSSRNLQDALTMHLRKGFLQWLRHLGLSLWCLYYWVPQLYHGRRIGIPLEFVRIYKTKKVPSFTLYPVDQPVDWIIMGALVTSSIFLLGKTETK